MSTAARPTFTPEKTHTSPMSQTIEHQVPHISLTLPKPEARYGIVDNVLDAIGWTPMVRLNRLFAEFEGAEVLGKLEYLNPNGSMKDRIGLGMITWAEQQGLLKPGDTLVEPTSGNTGLGICMAAAVKGYKVIITMPVKMSEEKRRLIKAFGAELILCPTELAFDHPDGYIEVAKRLAQQPNHVMLNQYENPGNPGAHYTTTGPEIWQQTAGQLDYFISGMGTGGIISGTSKFLKEKHPALTVVGVDPAGSIFSGDTVKPYQVEGIGYDFWPPVLNRPLIDEMVRVNDENSFAEGRRLCREEGILAGGSCGCVIAGTRQFLTHLQATGQLSATNPKRIVVVIHDTGRNYLTKMYNDEWMTEMGFIG
ncbi:MAG: cysteine synthase family protein [Vampirovibrionales bacterium]